MNEGFQSPTDSSRTTPYEEEDQPQPPDPVIRRRAEGGGNSNPDTIRLPKCEVLPLTIPPGIPTEVHASPQIVIAHRGASAHLPEHSLEGYRLALELGADYIEPDLVATADHHLVAMHSLDLTVTTNVEEVFGASKEKARSKYKQERMSGDGNSNEDDAMGYWVYDFTLEELKKLRLKQRLGGSDKNGRTQAFDGMFQIPTLTEILELLIDWNDNIQSLWYHEISNEGLSNNNKRLYKYPPPPRGLYAELKDFPWLLKDVNINLIDLFFDHIDANKAVWEKSIFQHMCITKRLREQEYKLPPLMMQSFEAEVLKDFTHRWEEIANNNNNDNSSGNNSTKSTLELTFEVSLGSSGGEQSAQPVSNETAHIPLPTPPRIMLISHDKCQDEQFWFEMEDSYRKVISGIGPDKMCFFKDQVAASAQDAALRYQPTVMEKARDMGWVVHPWTERPEEAYFATTVDPSTRRRLNQARLSPFENVLEEILFLKCIVGVHGVFSESVDVAVRAMGMACPRDDKGKHSSSNPKNSPSTKINTFDQAEIPLAPVIGFSFCAGILAALLMWELLFRGGARANNNRNNSSNEQQQPQRRRAPRIPGRRVSNLPPHFSVPTEATDDNDGDAPVVISDANREIL